MRAFCRELNVTPETRILDVGGYPFNWTLVPFRARVTLLNLAAPCDRAPGDVWLVADGTRLPFQSGAFDIVFSNSVIEHVGDLDAQQRFASEIRRVGRGYYVQTPNRGFPLEPHLLTPFIHYLPIAWRRRLARNWTVWGLITRPTPERAAKVVDEIRLLDRAEFQRLFPDGTLSAERVAGMAKSLVAVRRPDQRGVSIG